MSHIRDLSMMEDELRRYELEIAQGGGLGKPGPEAIYSMAQAMLATMSKCRSFFSEQTEIIRKISPPAGEQLDNILAAYEDAEAIIENGFQEESKKKGKDYMSPELVERLDEHVQDLIGCYDEMRKSTTLAYNSIAGVIAFMMSDDSKKAKGGAGRGGRKRGR